MIVRPEIRSFTATDIHVTMTGILKVLNDFRFILRFERSMSFPRTPKTIHCVTVNNIEGVRSLIGEGKTSPRDVNPEGVSLLHVGFMSHTILALGYL